MEFHYLSPREKMVKIWYWSSVALELCFVILLLGAVGAIVNPDSADPQNVKDLATHWHVFLIGMFLAVISGLWSCKYIIRYDL